MATAPRERHPTRPMPEAAPPEADSASTERLKHVPLSRDDRQRIRELACHRALECDRSRPPGRQAIEAHARAILAQLGLPEAFVGWTMVAVASAFWRDQIETIPHNRRLLLLPHCLRDSSQCRAEYNQLGLLCQDCGACRLSGLRARAEAKGYQVLIAEGSPTVIDIILRGRADALLGAACLNSLEKAFDKILLAGIPCMAVPLLVDSCRDTTTDVDWVVEMIDTPHRLGTVATRSYVHLLRLATQMFEPDELARLVPRSRGGPTLAQSNGDGLAGLEPVAATETIAHDFLGRGGKHFRPFITLAAYDAMTGGHAAGPDGAATVANFSDAVRRIALAIEVFHKASLVHDDIEDDDPYRYGQEAIHRRFGAPLAINVGDYLIGLGYRLVAAERTYLPGDCVADILGHLADAHTKLCEGQGAELAWRSARDKRIAPLEALKIYALKTAPAFEAAFSAGLRLAGPIGKLCEPVGRFSRHLGVAFQILNDLEDWQTNQPNKRTTGMDVLGGRPTILWALALENLTAEDCQQLVSLIAESASDSASVLEQVRVLYQRADVFSRARTLVAKHRDRAHEIADALEPVALSHLLHYLADTVLQG